MEIKDILNIELFTIGTFTLKLYTLITFILFVAVILVILGLLKRIIYRSGKLSSAEKFSINKISRYIIIFIALLISINIFGFDISIFLAGGAALLVGIGFGLQNIFNDFVSGLILLLDGSLKVDDIVEVNDSIYIVEEIKFRTTTVIGRDENYVILPNSKLTSNSVVNWTYNKKPSRFEVSVGVDYAADVTEVMHLLKEKAKATPRVLKQPEPFVRFEEYGEYRLHFSVYFYTYDIFRAENIRSLLRVEIFKELTAKGINIPLPQRVVEVKKEANKTP